MIFTKSYVLSFFREFVTSKNKHLGVLVNCSMCSGFWFGLFYSLIYNKGILIHLLFAGMISLLSYVVDLITNFLEIKTDELLHKKNN